MQKQWLHAQGLQQTRLVVLSSSAKECLLSSIGRLYFWLSSRHSPYCNTFKPV